MLRFGLDVIAQRHVRQKLTEAGVASPLLEPNMPSMQSGTGSVRFVLVPDFSKINRFGSVRFGSVRKLFFPGSTRFGLRFSDAAWLGPVRFGLFPRPVPAGSRITWFVSVRFGSVRFGFLFLPGVRPQQNCDCSWKVETKM